MRTTQYHGTVSVRAVAIVAAVCAVLSPLALAELVMNPKEIGGYVDVGQAFKQDFEKQPLTRTGTYLTVSGVHDERLEVRATLGGLFWYAFPELNNASRVVRFGPGVGQAQAIYAFGDHPGDPLASKLQFGLFPVKYNKDAANLGEYLYRSGTYPGYVATGGWSYLNSASFLMQGVRFSLPTLGGMIKHEITLHMERDVAQPLHDFSPGYMVTAKVPHLELGAGVVWSNALTFNSKRLAPKVADNAYSKSTGLPVKGLSDFKIDACSDSTQFANCYQNMDYGVPDTVAARATLNAWNACDTDANGTADANGDCSDIGYYTFRGFKGMIRGALDMGSLLGFQGMARNPGEFKVYSEVALLGIEDQPFYYEDKLERMPVMMGVSVPTFGILNRLAFEAEYRKSRFPNSFAYPFDNRGAIPIPLAGEASDTP